MIALTDLYQRTRLLAGDMQKAKYSDYEVHTAVKAAVDMLCEALIKYGSAELIRRAELTTADGRSALPEGFLSVANIEDNDGVQLFANYEHVPPFGYYRIEGDFLIAPEGVVKLTYMKNPMEKKQIDLAAGFLGYLAGICANLLAGEADAAASKAEEAAKMSAGDKRGVIPDPQMWQG